MNYHLSGYGIHYNEALASFLGESSERYAFTLLYQNLKKKNHICVTCTNFRTTKKFK
ncbi:YcaO-like family protein [Staphylococcus argenteus]|nr:YcaO-like family protein [Staphylococcus argenteus]